LNVIAANSIVRIPNFIFLKSISFSLFISVTFAVYKYWLPSPLGHHNFGFDIFKEMVWIFFAAMFFFETEIPSVSKISTRSFIFEL